jgi:hypothetical protein
MEIQQPNWLYCLSNELHEVDAETTLGKTHLSLSIFDGWRMKVLPQNDASQKYATEDCLYCIFNFGPESYCYMHIFRNVTDSDLTYMRLRYGFNRMYLVDDPVKSMLIANVADTIYLEVRCNRHLEEDDVWELQEKSLLKLAHCEVVAADRKLSHF